MNNSIMASWLAISIIAVIIVSSLVTVNQLRMEVKVLQAQGIGEIACSDCDNRFLSKNGDTVKNYFDILGDLSVQGNVNINGNLTISEFNCSLCDSEFNCSLCDNQFVKKTGDNLTGLLGINGLTNTNNSITLWFDPPIIETFESNYYGRRVEGGKLAVLSYWWREYCTSCSGGDEGKYFTLSLPTTEGHEWQNSTYGYFNDDSVDEYSSIQRLPRKDNGGNELYGTSMNNDWWEYSVYNISGSGTYGCFHGVSDPSGNANALHIFNGGYLIVADGDQTTPIMEVEQGKWYTIRVTTIYPNQWNLTVNGVTYGPYYTYMFVNWDYEEAGYGDAIEKLFLGTIFVLPADTCSFYIDNVTNSWGSVNHITIGLNNSLDLPFDYPAVYIEYGQAYMYIGGTLIGNVYE